MKHMGGHVSDAYLRGFADGFHGTASSANVPVADYAEWAAGRDAGKAALEQHGKFADNLAFAGKLAERPSFPVIPQPGPPPPMTVTGPCIPLELPAIELAFDTLEATLICYLEDSPERAHCLVRLRESRLWMRDAQERKETS